MFPGKLGNYLRVFFEKCMGFIDLGKEEIKLFFTGCSRPAVYNKEGKHNGKSCFFCPQLTDVINCIGPIVIKLQGLITNNKNGIVIF